MSSCTCSRRSSGARWEHDPESARAALSAAISLVLRLLGRDPDDLRVSTDERPYFVLKAGNNEIIGVSQMYASREARDGGMRAVRVNAAVAEVEG